MSQKRESFHPKGPFKKSSQKRSYQKDPTQIIKEVEIPGYFIDATLDLPRYHPHTIWWLAYISRLLKNQSLDSLIDDPPWPVPKDRFLISQLIKEMIDYQWLIPDWIIGSIEISPDIKQIYDIHGEIGLAQHFLSYETIKGQWWMDGLQGTPMDIRVIQKYHIDFSQTPRISPYRLKPNYDPEELLEQINIDLSLLTRMLQIPKKDFENLIPRAFLSSPFQITGPKDLRFELYGDPDSHGQKIIPGDLAVLEPMLWAEAPEIFGKKPTRKKNLFQWHRSPVDKFANTLEKFPDQLSLMASGQYYKNLGQILINELKKKDQWIQWYRTGLELIPYIGYAVQFFDALTEISEGTTDLDLFQTEKKTNELKKPEFLLISSSFLLERFLEKDEGLIASLESCSETAKILVIYGHANDDLPQKQQSDIDAYCQKLYSLNPSFENRLIMIPAKKRSHEKVILSSEGHWMISSWNPCSSNPDSTTLETGILGKNSRFALEILEVIKDLVEDSSALEIVQSLEESYRSGIKNEPQFDQEYENRIYDRLTSATLTFGNNLLENSFDQLTYEKNLNDIRLTLVPFLQKAQVRLINEHLSRDVLVSQIHLSFQDIIIATDRVSKGALDRTILQDILQPNIESKRFLRILWGMEWEEEPNLDPETKLQIAEAKKAIKDAIEVLGPQIKTSLNTMENHAKFALFDGSRGLITSDNLLAYGGEMTQYESRELGVFVESLPIIRYIEGKAIYHRLPLLQGDKTVSEMAYRPYEWLAEINDQYYALEDFQETMDNSDFEYLKSALFMKHVKPEKDDTSDFDIEILKKRWEHYKERQQEYKKPYFSELWRTGIKYYTVLPTSEPKWIPYSESLAEEEFSQIQISEELIKTLPTFNLLNPEINQSNDLNLPLSDNATLNSSTVQESFTIDPIIEEIMQDMIEIPAGTFMMGDSQSFKDRPVHKVTLSQPFYMGKYMVTQELWKKVMGSLPSMPKPKFRSPKFPIICVKFSEIMKFIQKLNSLPGGGDFDLPTDAQWEYTCRAGSTGDYCFGNDKNLLSEYAWSQLNAQANIHDVGLLKPNAWGLYDMHGLEFELVKDGNRKYTSEPIIDPIGPTDSPNLISRGGHWGRFPFPGKKYTDYFFRCGVRYINTPKEDKSYMLSFRLVRKIS